MAREILFVDTDSYMLKALKRVFRREQQWVVHYAEDAATALAILNQNAIKRKPNIHREESARLSFSETGLRSLTPRMCRIFDLSGEFRSAQAVGHP